MLKKCEFHVLNQKLLGLNIFTFEHLKISWPLFVRDRCIWSISTKFLKNKLGQNDTKETCWITLCFEIFWSQSSPKILTAIFFKYKKNIFNIRLLSGFEKFALIGSESYLKIYFEYIGRKKNEFVADSTFSR